MCGHVVILVCFLSAITFAAAGINDDTTGTDSTNHSANPHALNVTTSRARQLQAIAECVQARNKCKHRMAKCLPNDGAPAGACCSANFEFICIEPSFVWEQKSALELLNGFQKTAECKGKSFCVCEGPYFPQNRGRFGADVPHRLVGTCCDNSSECQCCWTNNTSVHLPAELSKINETKQCKAMVEEAECNCAPNPPDYPKTALPHSCVPDNAWPESACCAEGAHFECCAYPGMDVQQQAAKVLCDANDTKSDDCTAIGYYAKVGFDCEHPPEINSLCFFNFAIARHSVRASWPSTLTTLPNQTHENGKCSNAEEIKQICGCDSYKCVRNAGFADSVCCPENFEFTCCHLGQVSTTTVSTTITASTAKSAPTTTFKMTEETEPTTVSELTGNKTAGRPPLSCLLDKACTLNKQGSAKLGTRFVTNCEGISERIGLASNDKLRALGTEFLGTNGPLFLDEFVP